MKSFAVAVILAALLAPVPAAAQQWSAEQEEVWQTVVDCHALYFDEKIREESLACYHEDYSFWWAGDVLPFGKDLVAKAHESFIESETVAVYDLRPVKIIVRGDTAFVHWGLRMFRMDGSGNPVPASERISMMMVKEDGRWRYYAGGGSEFKQ
jgi:ketosteroid isomerase-like protein